MTGRKPYVTNEQINEAWRESKAAGKLQPRLAEYLRQIAEKYSRHPWFVGYSFREDMIAEATLALIESWHKFDPDKVYGDPKAPKKSNAFAYYTRCCYFVFLRYMNLEKEQTDLRNKMLIEMGYDPSFNFELENKYE